MTEEQRVRLNALLESARAAADELVEESWPAIKKVATFLEEHQRLNGDEVATIVRNSGRRTSSLP
jgi:hypothetical protein